MPRTAGPVGSIADIGFATFTLIDTVGPGGFGDGATLRTFHDLCHLSRTGAEPFTPQLWELPELHEPLLAALGLGD